MLEFGAASWLFGKVAGSALGMAFKRAKDKVALRRASSDAMGGRDFAIETSLESLVHGQLEVFAASPNFPPELNSDEFRSWVLSAENSEKFVRVLVSKAGDDSGAADDAIVTLAESFELATGVNKKLAIGPITLVISHVIGVLRATADGTKKLHTALAFASIAQVRRLTSPTEKAFPLDADLARVRNLAGGLLATGMNNWKMPRFIAPMNLETRIEEEDNSHRSVDSIELADLIDGGGSIVLYGDGGIGKTTFLLDLCTQGLKGGKLRVPLFLDAAAWARSNVSLFDYLARSPSAVLNQVTAAELMKLAAAGHLTILVNGWNEIPESQKLFCRDEFNSLTAVTAALNSVIVSRAHSDAATRSNSMRVKVQGLTWRGQLDVISKELEPHVAAPLLELLSTDTSLRHAARSPLILRGLVENARKGDVRASSVFDLLGAVVQAFEEDTQRSPLLKAQPLSSFQRFYLEELACFLTSLQATSCSRDEALPCLSVAVEGLVARRYLSPPPSTISILEALASHHLLQFEDGAVRFAHHRFQEYFVATRLLRECIEGSDDSVTLHAAANSPAWEESLMLVAERLSTYESAAPRVRLIRTAVRVDLGLACDLANFCGFVQGDAPDLHNEIVKQVNALVSSPLEEVHDLGVALQIATGFADFSSDLWTLLESDNQNARLSTYRLNGGGISLKQLGTNAESRVATWDVARRVEFVHEMADNPENFEFLVRVANSEPANSVRAAAITALFWNFPASQEQVRAWLSAPIEVQTDRSVVSCISHELEQGYSEHEIRQKLQSMSLVGISESTQLSLVHAFPNEVGSRLVDVVLKTLRNASGPEEVAVLVKVAEANASADLLELAQELALSGRGVADWVFEFFQTSTAKVRTSLFETAWGLLLGPEVIGLSADLLGPFADRRQIERSVDAWLQCHKARSQKKTSAEVDRERQLLSLLGHAVGNELIGVVLGKGVGVTYDEASALLDLVCVRTNDGSSRLSKYVPWKPSVDEVKQLFVLFGGLDEGVPFKQDTVFVYLCRVASRVAPEEFRTQLLEGCHRQLEAWTPFNQWLKAPRLPRPNNPSEGRFIALAVSSLGPDVIQDVLEFMAHPNAMNLVPDILARICSMPWNRKSGLFPAYVEADVKEGRRRAEAGRALRQPDDKYQQATDEAARVLGRCLVKCLDDLVAVNAEFEKDKPGFAQWVPRDLVRVVSNLPSGEIEAPLNRALASGLVDVYGLVDGLRGLLSQGGLISDALVVAQIELQHTKLAAMEWLDESAKTLFSELNELLYYVSPSTLLSKPLTNHLERWTQVVFSNEVVRRLGRTTSADAWISLVALNRTLHPNRKGAEVAEALVSVLHKEHFGEFLQLIADGTLFSLCSGSWQMRRIAPGLALVIGSDGARREAFVETCRRVGSSDGDVLASLTLALVKGGESACLQIGLDAINAGRVVHSGMPGFQMLLKLFQLEVPMQDSGHFEIHQVSRNTLRAHLFETAKVHGAIGDGCRRLLAAIECQRREDSRPLDEVRHPNSREGNSWTSVLVA